MPNADRVRRNQPESAWESFHSRREFGKFVLAAIPAFAVLPGATLQAQSAPRPNRSLINGVQFGLQPFCYHDLAMTPENRGTLIERLVQNGLGMVELHATWVEPRFAAAGVSPAAAREKLREWRVTAPQAFYQAIKKEFDDAGIVVFTYYVNLDDSHTDEEIDAIFRGARILGAQGCVGSQGLRLTQRLAPFPGRHAMFMGVHNHANLSDPDALNNEASFVKALSFSPHVQATLDTRHYTAANGDCLEFLARHHARTSSVHLGDRKRNNGRSTPFGEGDAPIIQILRMIRDNQWPIVALLEFEHGTLRTGVDEVQLMFDYCKRAVA
jgi:sugar phosphate isomerase/epimerase